MQLIFALVAIAALAVSPPLCAAERAKNRWSVESATLANGLEVIVLPQKRAPVVYHQLLYKVGSAEDGPGKSGIAHYLEHLMFKGTEKTPPGVFNALVRRHGGRQNAFTSLDDTVIFRSCRAIDWARSWFWRPIVWPG